ncbi:MAG TPA: DUF4333 domain-containing protein [Nocardioides sp.]|nr:DUF4333 domain-containing protein [Nocardioides sp.]
MILGFRTALTGAAATAALSLSACGVSVHASATRTISADSVQTKIHDFWVSKVRDNVQGVHCPQGLDDHVGDAVVCVLTATDGSAINVTVSVESEGQLHIQVANEPLHGPTATATP